MIKNGKVVIYTALFGGYDLLIEPPKKFLNSDFICFTDDPNLVSDIWDIRIVDNVSDPVKANREIKFLPHKFIPEEYSYSIYIDSNIKIINDPYDLAIASLENGKICIPEHFERNCIYEELDECLSLGKINNDEFEILNETLKKDGYPRAYGLGENNIIIREHHDPEVIFLMQKWWDFFLNGPKRDQLSLLYLAWKFNIQIEIIKESSRNKNKYFRYELHLNEKKLPIIKRSYLYIRANRERNLYYKIFYNFKRMFF